MNVWMETGGIKMEFELTNKSIDDESDPITWEKWYEGVKAEGDSYSIKTDRLSFKEANEQPAFFAVDEMDNIGISVFCAHHPNAKFTDATPHGIRLANAIGRAFSLEGSVSADDLCTAVNTCKDDVVIQVKKTAKGILWTVTIDA